MLWLVRFARSSVGGKVLMAVTGAGLVLFVVAHLAGNLLTFAGQEAFNAYAHALQAKRPLVWGLRTTLLVGVLIHVAAGIRLSLQNGAARPTGYAVANYKASTRSGRRMLLSGVLLAGFIVYHLAHFTAGVIDHHLYERYDALGRHDAYAMFVLGFQQPLIAGSYILAMLFLFGHLAHGIASLFQSLGLRAPRWQPLIDRLGYGLALVLVLGNIAMPLAALFGVLTMPAGG